jgi:multidrug efflux pump subunit AcrB
MFSLFYDNTRLLVLAICLILVAGLSSYYVLPRMEDPVLTQRAATITTFYPGAGAERVEALVTEKLEEELQQVEEIKEMRSSSRSGISTVIIELKDDVYQVAEVWSRVRDKLDDAKLLLPPGAGDPDFEILEPMAYASIVALVWELPEEPNYAILRRQAEALEDRLRAIPGTRDVDMYGTPSEEIVAEIRQDQLASMGLTVAEVSSQLRASDAKISAGVLRTERGNLLLEVDSEMETLDRIRRTPIHFGDDGRFVELDDIAEVNKGIIQPQSSLAIVDGKAAIALGILVREQQRIDHWTDQMHRVLAQFSANLSGGIRLSTIFEQNRYVATRLATLLRNLLLGATAVIAVVCFMMGWRSAVVVGLALPLVSLMVLSGMRMLDVPMHQMSITGLIIALGLLIDNAIIMVDEVRLRLNRGNSPRDAVARSVRYLAVPLAGSTVTTALSFAPIALMPGPTGEFVGSIAISVILAVASSLLLALTITPSLMALLEGSRREKSDSSWWNHGFSRARVTAAYRRSLGYVFHRPWLGVGMGMALPAVGFLLALSLTEQFFPPADRDQFQIELTLSAQSSIAHTEQVARAARQRLLAHAQIDAVHWFIGESAPPIYYNMLATAKGKPQYAQALVQVSSDADLGTLIRQLQVELNQEFPEARFLVRQLEQGPPFNAPIELRLFGPDLAVLRELGDEVREILSRSADVVHTTATLAEALPKLAVQVDEQQARLAGLDHESVARQLDQTLEGVTGGSVLESKEELPVRVRVSDARRGDLRQIAALDLLPAAGMSVGPRRKVPLSSLATITLHSEVSVVPHFNTLRMNEVQAFTTAGVLPAGVLAHFRQQLDESNFHLPVGYHYEFGGVASKRDDAVGSLMSSVGVLMVLMVATLVLSFGSFRIAGMIGIVAVLSVGLSLGSLALFGYPFGFMAIIGTMGLIGVAINDTIVVLAALRNDPQARAGQADAVRDVVVRSTRHVLSTTLTTIAGFLPLLLSGGGFWPPLATAIAGGITGATFLALYFIPSAYVLAICHGGNAAECA